MVGSERSLCSAFWRERVVSVLNPVDADNRRVPIAGTVGRVVLICLFLRRSTQQVIVAFYPLAVAREVFDGNSASQHKHFTGWVNRPVRVVVFAAPGFDKIRQQAA